MLTAAQPVITPDVEVPLRLYGTTITQADLTPIPSRDLPAGLPAWMCALDAWELVRTGATAQLELSDDLGDRADRCAHLAASRRVPRS